MVIAHGRDGQTPGFFVFELPCQSDAGEDLFIPKPEKEFPPVHCLKIWEITEGENV
jgi:hypothetical protein